MIVGVGSIVRHISQDRDGCQEGGEECLRELHSVGMHTCESEETAKGRGHWEQLKLIAGSDVEKVENSGFVRFNAVYPKWSNGRGEGSKEEKSRDGLERTTVRSFQPGWKVAM